VHAARIKVTKPGADARRAGGKEGRQPFAVAQKQRADCARLRVDEEHEYRQLCCLAGRNWAAAAAAGCVIIRQEAGEASRSSSCVTRGSECADQPRLGLAAPVALLRVSGACRR
jgi:hypothetical protein